MREGLLFLSVHCDEFRGRAHAQLAGREAHPDGPSLRFTDTESGRTETSSSAGYQASDWPVKIKSLENPWNAMCLSDVRNC